MSDIQADANADEKTEQSPYQFGTWYPIETAPKDGTHILAYPVLLDVACVVSWYGNWEKGFWRLPMTEKAALYTPIRWMPLPPAPSQGDRTDEDADKDRA